MVTIVFTILLGVTALLAWYAGRQSNSEFMKRILGLVRKAAFGLMLILLVLSTITIVPAGYVGVVDFVGYVSPTALTSGMHFVNPFARIVKMNVKTQEIKEEMSVPSQEGLMIGLEISTIYHLNPEKAPLMYRSVGLNFVETLLEPNARSSVRDVTAMYNAQALYSPARGKLSQEILERVQKAVGDRGIVIEEIPMRRVTLPTQLQEAIAQKLTAEQQSQQMQFVLQKESQEADRKRIEAQGIADFQRTVMKGIDRNFLIWKAIDASKELASSPNTKVVVFGGSEKSMPLILNPDHSK